MSEITRELIDAAMKGNDWDLGNKILYEMCARPEAHPWVTAMLARKPPKLVAVAMANKAARIAWVVMTRGEFYVQPQHPTLEVATN